MVFMAKEIKKVCDECGIEANRRTCMKIFQKPPRIKKFSASTYHEGRCDCCGLVRPVTEPRDFFYPDFSLLNK